MKSSSSSLPSTDTRYYHLRFPFVVLSALTYTPCLLTLEVLQPFVGFPHAGLAPNKKRKCIQVLVRSYCFIVCYELDVS